MNQEQGHFWYSSKQLGALEIMGWYRPNYCELDNGKVVQYTEWTREKKVSSVWDDFVYLGHGIYHHAGEVRDE